MQSMSAVLCVALLWAAHLEAQVPHVTLRQIQEVPYDSLVVADSLQNTVPARWTLQTSPYYQDTVTVTAVCVVPAKTLTFTQRGWTMLLADTGASPYPWGGILVRVGLAADTSQAILDGFLNVERGDVITMRGRVDEFPNSPIGLNSATQFVPIPGVPIQILGTAPVPPPAEKTVPDFFTGIFPGGLVKYTTGEPYEGIPVNLATPLTVDARVNAGRGTFSMVDGEGNQITDYDASRYFTLKGTSSDHPAPDSIWTIIYPTVGSALDTMRGFITTVSATENARGYRISPIFRGDVVIGIVRPSVTTHRRNPIVVPPDSAARITVRVTRQSGGFPIAGVSLMYSLNNAPFVTLPMSYNAADSTHGAEIPNQVAGTFVHYFVQAQDSAGNLTTLASSAFGGAGSDTAKGFFFYTVLDRPMTIHDLQYTPYLNGRSPYLGAFVTVNGIVTADTAHIGASPLTSGGTNAWYMQSGTGPWNGLWFVGSDQALFDLRNGDSIAIGGFVGEQFDVTRLSGVQSPITVFTSGNPEPAPVPATTGMFGPIVGNGTPAAEQYEGMLVRFNNVRVSSVDQVFNDNTEFEVDDGSGLIIVRRDGTHHFSNVPADSAVSGKTILRVGERISSLTGIIYYSFNRYKIVPRDDADFGTITSVETDRHSMPPEAYSLDQNYPNPFNPSTTITYTLPQASLVKLRLYNILGQEVATLVNGRQNAGRHTTRLDASSLPTGVYFYRLQARGTGEGTADVTRTMKMLLLK
jgi:hypothetical protein